MAAPVKVSKLKMMKTNNDSEHISSSHVVLTNGSELSFIGQECSVIPSSLGRTYGEIVTRLDMSFNCLRSIQGLEMFSHLEELILDNNQLDDHIGFPPSDTVNTISLNKNKFLDLELLLLKLKGSYPQLRYLSLLGNPACPDQLSSNDKDEEDYQRYRYYVIHCIPGLKFLDSKPVHVKEFREAKRVGAFMRVIRPEELAREQDGEGENDVSHGDFLTYTPLPLERQQEGGHSGIYGVCKYRYSGRHSEGNRFIRNHDL
jgi:hypothetical protein